MRYLAPFVVLLPLAACSSPAGQPPQASAGGHAAAAAATPPPRLVVVDLVADVAEARAGAAFRVGVRFRVAPGWHIYWENPGESGLKTRATVSAPDGFVVGPVRYPGPDRFEAMDLTSYGYEKETMLIAAIQAPADLAPGSAVALTAEAQWLACKEACVPGKASTALTLAVGAAAEPDSIAHYASHLPRPLGELAGVEVVRSGTARDPGLEVRVAGADGLEFFPGASPSLELRSSEPGRDGGTFTLRLAFRTLEGAAQPEAPRGVLRVRRGDGDHFYEITGT